MPAWLFNNVLTPVAEEFTDLVLEMIHQMVSIRCGNVNNEAVFFLLPTCQGFFRYLVKCQGGHAEEYTEMVYSVSTCFIPHWFHGSVSIRSIHDCACIDSTHPLSASLFNSIRARNNAQIPEGSAPASKGPNPTS